jgi:hypothetical protein
MRTAPHEAADKRPSFFLRCSIAPFARRQPRPTKDPE